MPKRDRVAINDSALGGAAAATTAAAAAAFVALFRFAVALFRLAVAPFRLAPTLLLATTTRNRRGRVNGVGCELIEDALLHTNYFFLFVVCVSFFDAATATRADRPV
jgi:hypothetical protein